MITKQRTIAIFIAAMILGTTACRLGEAFTPPAPTSTNTPILPVATSTNTPIPPTPTIVVIQGSNDPIVIGDFNLNISTVELNEKGFNGMAPYPMTADQTVLAVEVTLISGDLEKLSSLTLWVNDGQGNRTDSGATLSTESKNQVVWLFPVAKTSDSFILHFPSGEIIALAPLLP
jgi:hypothetical protein